MPKWLSRTLLVLVTVVLLASAVYGAFRIGRLVGSDREVRAVTLEKLPRFDRDRIQPNLREDRIPDVLMPRTFDRFSLVSRFPLARLLLGALGALVRFALLVLLIWLVVKFVTRAQQPAAPAVAAPSMPPPPPTEPTAAE